MCNEMYLKYKIWREKKSENKLKKTQMKIRQNSAVP
jgi:hypothetical protein